MTNISILESDTSGQGTHSYTLYKQAEDVLKEPDVIRKARCLDRIILDMVDELRDNPPTEQLPAFVERLRIFAAARHDAHIDASNPLNWSLNTFKKYITGRGAAAIEEYLAQKNGIKLKRDLLSFLSKAKVLDFLTDEPPYPSLTEYASSRLYLPPKIRRMRSMSTVGRQHWTKIYVALVSLKAIERYPPLIESRAGFCSYTLQYLNH